jgi:predicted ATPase
MYLSKFRVENYKSFRDSGEIEFKPGINIIVGQNNSGKTALLEALSMQLYAPKPHNNNNMQTKTYLLKDVIKQQNNGKKQPPKIKAVISIDSNELQTLEGSKIKIPAKEEKSVNILNNVGSISYVETINSFNQSFKNGLQISFDSSGYGPNNNEFKYSFNNYIKTERVSGYKEIIFRVEKNNTLSQNNVDYNLPIDELGKILTKDFCSKLYKFEAERRIPYYSKIGTNRVLASDGSNLPEVLNLAQTFNSHLFEQFNELVNEVIPTIKWVQSPIKESEKHEEFDYEIEIWNSSRETQREELVVSLLDCGTGVGQVLAILHVIITSKNAPRTIIIDEPNSFLHPAASKKLIQILNRFPQHQYFISTHSSEIVTTAKASTITMLKYVDGETIAEQLDLSTGNDKLKLVEELGIEMSDFFFAENVLWVEGPTEAKAFPMILKESVCLVNYVAVPLVSTDDLRDRKKGRKHARTIKENYDTLSGKYALTPPNIFTVLDREQTTPTEICDLQKLGIEFIPRCMYENYLLDAQAITDVLNAEMIDETNKITVEQVQAMLDSSFAECEDKTKWLAEVHSANLLYDIFSKLTDAKVRFDKTDHSIKLTKWLLANKPEELQELQDFLVKLLNKPKDTN